MTKAKPAARPARGRSRRLAATRSLRRRLAQAEQALAAVRDGGVDALLAPGGGRGADGGDGIFRLEGSDHGYRALMEAMSEGVAALNGGGLVTYCNVRFTSTVGARPELTVGRPIARFMLPADLERFEALLSAGTHGRSEGEFWMQTPGGSPPTLVRLAVVSLMMDGARTHCVVMTDLTEQRRQSAALAAEREQMQKRLQQADRMASLGTLAAGVAHEINNPLSYLTTTLELMGQRLAGLEAAGGAPPEPLASLRGDLTRARGGAERVQNIVSGLQAFTRADDTIIAVIDPRLALDASIQMASSEVRHRAALVTDYADLPPVRANAGRLEQVFLNLLVNAAQAIAPGAASRNEIRVSGRRDPGGRAVIEIRDTGAGVDAQNLPHLFDPFFTTKAVREGAGLGLSICNAIVTSLGGEITAESQPGAGSVFRVVLPGVDGAAPAVAPQAPASPALTSRGRLLFIDDEADLCEVMKEALVDSHDVTATTSARQALALIDAGQRFDLILCDIRMPEMTGLDFAARLQTDCPDQASHLVLMSGGQARARVPGAPATLPRPLLAKPFELGQVVSLLGQALRGEALLPN